MSICLQFRCHNLFPVFASWIFVSAFTCSLCISSMIGVLFFFCFNHIVFLFVHVYIISWYQKLRQAQIPVLKNLILQKTGYCSVYSIRLRYWQLPRTCTGAASAYWSISKTNVAVATRASYFSSNEVAGFSLMKGFNILEDQTRESIQMLTYLSRRWAGYGTSIPAVRCWYLIVIGLQ